MKILLSLLAIALSLSVSATHLIGGNLGYEYIGKVGSMYRYKLILTTYTNCDATSNITYPESDVTIGVYQHDIQNDPMGGGNKLRIDSITINLTNAYIN